MLEKKLIKLSLTALAALVLTACGSSGGDGDSSDSAVNKVENSAKKVEDKAKETGKQAEDKAKEAAKKAEEEIREEAEENKLNINYAGGGFSFDGKPGNLADVKAFDITGDEASYIVVDGNKLDIVPQLIGINAGNINLQVGWQVESNGDRYIQVCCGTKTTIDKVKIGTVYNKYNDRFNTFYYGTMTAVSDLPQDKNVVRYTGKDTGLFVILADNDNKTYLKNLKVNPDLNVNFDTKKVEGFLGGYDPKLKKDVGYFAKVEADMKGSTFDGKLTTYFTEESNQKLKITSDADQVADLKGAFYGEKAEELAAEAHNQKWGVVFAAEKQK